MVASWSHAPCAAACAAALSLLRCLSLQHGHGSFLSAAALRSLRLQHGQEQLDGLALGLHVHIVCSSRRPWRVGRAACT